MDCNSVSLASIDFNHNLASCRFVATQTVVVGSAIAQVMGWCDDGWGFSRRLSDTAALFGSP
jgi:glyceraldehyde-3-phosphate dehydrogenase/erythrose-4-phosphate dehydrogenase